MTSHECGFEMNHHADKIDYPAANKTDAHFEDVLQEVPSRLGCGGLQQGAPS